MAERRLASVDSPSWRARLDAVKAQMEDSSLKVELAEQEMRRAVQTMRDEQRTSAHNPTRQRSLADMQELIHGLREEQMQAKQALHACLQVMRMARGRVALHIALGWERYRVQRIWSRWVSAALGVVAGQLEAECDRLQDGAHSARRQIEALEAQLRTGGYELEERSIRTESLSVRVSELQAALARRTTMVAAEAEEDKERQMGEVHVHAGLPTCMSTGMAHPGHGAPRTPSRAGSHLTRGSTERTAAYAPRASRTRAPHTRCAASLAPSAASMRHAAGSLTPPVSARPSAADRAPASAGVARRGARGDHPPHVAAG